MAKDVYERIGELEGAPALDKTRVVKTHADAVEQLLEELTDARGGVIENINQIDAVGHRIVHGGEDFRCSQIVDSSVMDTLKENTSFAPIHAPANIMGIRKHMPGICMVGVFDTAYHNDTAQSVFVCDSNGRIQKV